MKVSAKNFTEDVKKISWKGIPEGLEEDKEQIATLASVYSDGGDIKDAVDAYVAALNEAIIKRDAEEPKGPSNPVKKKKAPAKKAPGNIMSPYIWDERVMSWLQTKYLHGRSNARDMFVAESKKLRDLYDEGKSPEDACEIVWGKKKARGKKKAPAKKAPAKKKGPEAEELRKMKAAARSGKYAKLTRKEVLNVAHKFNAARRQSAITNDLRQDHRKRLSPTPENLIRWMADYGKYDLIGVDNFKLNDPTADLKIRKEIFWNRLGVKL
jgi:hypothetical protein